jgi:hypothetical protein
MAAARPLFEKYSQPYEFVALIKRTLWGLTIQEVKPSQKFELLEPLRSVRRHRNFTGMVSRNVVSWARTGTSPRG